MPSDPCDTPKPAGQPDPTQVSPSSDAPVSTHAGQASGSTPPMPGAPVIVVAEDDPQIRAFIVYALTEHGCVPIKAPTAKQALRAVANNPVRVLLLDLGLPDGDGLEVIRTVRTWSQVPIIVVSARDQDEDKVTALDAGADDYLTKPFSASELLARIRVALRHGERTTPTTHRYSVGDLVVDVQTREVSLGGVLVHVTPLEYALLVVLCTHIGKVVTTSHVLREVYGVGYGTDTQALRTLMAGLRRKIEVTPAKPRYILTEIGVGYRLVDQ